MAVAAAFVLGLVALVFQRWFAWPCPLRVMCGIPCPTCGMTRAFRLVLGGHLGEATRMHPLWFVVIPVVGALLALELGIYVGTGRLGGAARFTRARSVRWLLHAILAALLIVWLARFFGAFGGPAAI